MLLLINPSDRNLNLLVRILSISVVQKIILTRRLHCQMSEILPRPHAGGTVALPDWDPGAGGGALFPNPAASTNAPSTDDTGALLITKKCLTA